MRWLTIFGVFFGVLTYSHTLYAWGPGMHLEYGLGALIESTLFLPWIARLLEKYRNDFLYGCIAADITLGKKFIHYNYHCHNWKVALDLLETVDEDHQKAFMLGYLCHLAADTVSHNYFVPFYSIKSFRTNAHRHTYWEMCMDAHCDDDVINMGSVFKNDYYLQHDRLLEKKLRTTLFSFKTNKFIFNTLLSVQRMKRYRDISQKLAQRPERTFSLEEAQPFKDLCSAAIHDIFGQYEHATCLQADPTGRLKIKYASETVKRLRHYDREGRLTAEGERLLMRDIATTLHDGLYQPVLLPHVEDYIV